MDEKPPVVAAALPVTVEQMVQLITLFGTALIRSGLSADDVQYLLEQEDQFSETVTDVLRSMTNPLIAARIPVFPLDLTTPLTDLVQSCKFSDCLIDLGRFADLTAANETELWVISFREKMQANQVYAQLREWGFRAAMLREVLSLVKAQPDFLHQHPELIVCGCAAVGNAEIHPYIECQGNYRRLSCVNEEIELIPGTHFIVAARVQP